ncbi:hypothetical protein L935_07760 [Helicobacter pylori PZ5086]|nr:hypothetical protein L935_07760 [Helicobacter pylori PZ5086]
MGGFCFLNSLFKLSFFGGGFDEKSFLVFFILVSGKLDANSSGNLLKKRFFRGV